MRFSIIAMLSLCIGLATPGSAQTWKDIFGQVTGAHGRSGDAHHVVDENEAARGLKQALEIGARSAIARASKKNGFFGNPLIRIQLPKTIRSTGKVLRRIGLGTAVDRFDRAMNRAAEQASSQALPILTDAVKGLTIKDALSILRGGHTAATDFLRMKTSDRLRKELKPIITAAMQQTGVTHRYEQLMDQAGPFLQITGQQPQHLDDYVTDQTLAGLFTLIAQQETKIRTDPVARTTRLLKKVFGSLTKTTAQQRSSRRD